MEHWQFCFIMAMLYVIAGNNAKGDFSKIIYAVFALTFCALGVYVAHAT